MATTTRIYVVAPKVVLEGEKPEQYQRLVRATHPSHALKHVTDSLYGVAVASADDLERLLPKGVKVERIGHEQQELPT